MPSVVGQRVVKLNVVAPTNETILHLQLSCGCTENAHFPARWSIGQSCHEPLEIGNCDKFYFTFGFHIQM
jgi:hypothetical protein